MSCPSSPSGPAISCAVLAPASSASSTSSLSSNGSVKARAARQPGQHLSPLYGSGVASLLADRQNIFFLIDPALRSRRHEESFRSALHGSFDTPADTAAIEIQTYLGELVRARRAHPAEDLISALVADEDDEHQLTEEKLVTMTAFILAAGFETTTGLLATGFLTLLSTPHEADRLRREPARKAGRRGLLASRSDLMGAGTQLLSATTRSTPASD